MHGMLPVAGKGATASTCKSASDETASGRSASDDADWFADAAQNLLAKPGLELHLDTGVDESLCYRYAGGKVRPPAYFLRQLLRSPQGERWLNAVMDGSEAGWWLALRRARRIASAVDQAI